ncbi:MAG TPA: hypothetical protein DC049_13715 [Spirochaetia bacterium]|nr:hypothetical protein [Spirochaetia bacterium]
MRILFFITILSVLSANSIPPEDISLIKKKNNLSDNAMNLYLPVLHPIVKEPIAEGVSLLVPHELGNQKLAKNGILDITASPFSADASGKKDSTKAIQDAVNFARDRQMALYFPPGKYVVSDTIDCLQKLTYRGNGAISGADVYPVVMIGSAIPGKRSVIYLAPKSRGFTDANIRKIIVHFNSLSNGGAKRDREAGPEKMQVNISYNNLFTDIDIVIGEGNPGAVGIRMHGAEGSSIQSVTIDATHGHTGMLSLAGGGGSHHNITVIGGRIGIDTRGWDAGGTKSDGAGTQPTPTMAHVKLFGQTEAPLFIICRGPFVGVGMHIKVKPFLSAVILKKAGDQFFNSTLCLVDSVIEFEKFSANNTFLSYENGCYLRNVFIKNCENLTENIRGNSGGWIKIKELTLAVTPAPFKALPDREPFLFDQNPVVDGKRTENIIFLEKDTEPPADIVSRHLWKHDPSWQDEKAANVKDQYGAKGDTKADDTKALQKAIDENEIVFLPKGYYRITDTLKLKPHTKLIGIAQNLSYIIAMDPFTGFAGSKEIKPMVETSDAKDAATVISRLGIFIGQEVSPDTVQAAGGIIPCYTLKWQCGGDSSVRMAWFKRGRIFGFPQKKREGIESLKFVHPLVLITGNGGGKWYNFFNHGAELHEDYRHMLITNCQGPIAFYHYHAQDNDGYCQSEIADSANIDIYGVKVEYETRFIRVRNSRQVRIFGHAGVAYALEGTAHFIFENSTDYLVSNINDQLNLAAAGTKHLTQIRTSFELFYPLQDISGKNVFSVPSLSRPIVIKKGNP